MPAQKVTLRDVANTVGVSTSTVSLVLNKNPRISEPTQRRVMAAVQELGYVYNQRAASLRTQRSYTVGLIITDIANPFYAELTSGIEDYLNENNYSLLLATTRDNLDYQQRQITTIRERDAEGIMLVPAVGTSADDISTLQQFVPLILVTRYLPRLEVDYIGIDNEVGARRGIEHLIQNGHRRIAFIGGHENSSARRDRLEGYRSMLVKHSIELDSRLSIPGNVSRRGGYNAVQALLQVPDPPTAALCYNDVVAYGVMLGLRDAGIEPGQDFAVVGFDDVAESSLWNPPLATIAARPAEMGREAARLLINRIEQPDLPVEQVIMPSTLIQRASASTRL